jgi:glycosyltransferase involved in cell wall biosynthesis
MRIAFVTTGRFHICDLARELHQRGHEVKFYSLVPTKRLIQFGIPKESARWLLPAVILPALCSRLFGNSPLGTFFKDRLTERLDQVASRRLEACDAMIGMSGMCNRVAIEAKRKFGAAIWIERGSRHILSQRDILQAIPGAEKVSQKTIDRELVDYVNADRIAVLSQHCLDSFLARGVSSEKLVRNPLGVNLGVFKSTPVPSVDAPTIIMTGTWCLRKGSDILHQAWKQLPGYRLMHVGVVGDYPLPVEPGFTHYDKVDQNQLIQFYSQAHVFALGSREEGLATVQPQALACGLRLVCTTRTGGEDLKSFVADPECISVVEPDDVNSFRAALASQMKLAVTEVGLRNRLREDARHNLSWAGYAQRYEMALSEFELLRKSTRIGLT